MRQFLTLAVLLVALAGVVGSAQAIPFYAVTSFEDDSVHLFTPFFGHLGSFPTGGLDPNGVASIGSTLYVAHLASSEMIAFNLGGNELFRWSNATLLDEVQGLAAVNRQLAIADGSAIHFVDPATGALHRSLTGPDIAGDIEGLVFDGDALWALRTDSIVKLDIVTGATLASTPNVLAAEPFGGTGIALAGPNSLVLVSTTGKARFVVRADGHNFASLDVPLSMYGITRIDPVVPEPGTLALFGIGALGLVGLVRRRSRRLS